MKTLSLQNVINEAYRGKYFVAVRTMDEFSKGVLPPVHPNFAEKIYWAVVSDSGKLRLGLQSGSIVETDYADFVFVSDTNPKRDDNLTPRIDSREVYEIFI